MTEIVAKTEYRVFLNKYNDNPCKYGLIISQGFNQVYLDRDEIAGLPELYNMMMGRNKESIENFIPELIEKE